MARLDLAAREWLSKAAGDGEEEDVQRRLRESATRYIGAFAGDNPRRAESARQSVQERLRRRSGR